MIAISDESKGKLIKVLDRSRRMLPPYALDEDRAEVDSLIAELENADPVMDPALVRAVYDADCTMPAKIHGITKPMSDALGALYRAAGLVKEATA